MQVSNNILDNFGAPKLSELTECGAPVLDEPPDYLWAFALNGAVNGLIQRRELWLRIVLMFGRRVDLAIREYRTGRCCLEAYVQRLPANASFLVAMRATTHFEQCVAATCQATALIDRFFAARSLTKSPDHDKLGQRLKRIWNRSKHFDDDLGGRFLASAEITAPVWLTNVGISCSENEDPKSRAPSSNVTFRELHAALTDLLDALKFLTEEQGRLHFASSDTSGAG